MAPSLGNPARGRPALASKAQYRPMTMRQFDVVIVGAGFGGIGAAIQLNRLGYDNIVILDREDDLGGTSTGTRSRR